MGGTHQIIQVNGHYEVYNEYGDFVLSGDTYEECYEEIRMENNRGKVSA